MGLEIASFISDLDSANPLATDPKSQGDDHIRNFKFAVKNSWPGITGAVTTTHTQLNFVAGVTSAIQTQLNGKAATGAGVALSAISAAVAAATLGNANNAIAWDWKLTSAAIIAMEIGETTASTGGAGSQDLLKIATLAASTANPLRVQVRGMDALVIGRTGVIALAALDAPDNGGSAGSALTITAGHGATAVAGTGGAVALTAGNARFSGAGGAVTLTSGAGAGGGASGAVSLVGAAGAPNGVGGAVNLTSGAGGGTGSAGAINLTGANRSDAAVGNAGAIVLTAGSNSGSGVGADVTLSTGTGPAGNGKINFVNTGAANGAVATTLGSVGPTGATAGNPVGWLAIKVAGVARFIPYW